MSSIYSFRLNDSDKEIEEVLSELSGKERSAFIKQALYFYIQYGDKLNGISNGIDMILSKLEDMSCRPLAGQLTGKSEETLETDKTEMLLMDSIKDLINL